MFELLLSAAAFYWQRRGKLEVTSWILVGTLYAIFILGLSLSGFTFTIALLLAIVISLTGLMLKYYSVIAVTVFAIITLWVIPSIVSVPVEITARELVYTTVILALEGLILIVARIRLKKDSPKLIKARKLYFTPTLTFKPSTKPSNNAWQNVPQRWNAATSTSPRQK